MKKAKTPVFSYILYVLAGLTALYSINGLYQGISSITSYLAQVTGSELEFSIYSQMFALVVEPLSLKLGTAAIMVAAGMLLKRSACGTSAAVETEDDDFADVNPDELGTILSNDDLEEAKTMVEAQASVSGDVSLNDVNADSATPETDDQSIED